MNLSNAKDELKVQAYRSNIPYFTKQEFGEPMDQNKKDFFEKALNLHNNRFLVSAARDYGKTWLQAILALWSTGVISKYYGEPYRVALLGGSREQSKNAYRIIKEYIDRSDFMSKQIDGRPKTKETNFKDGSRIKTLAASDRSIRGQHSELLSLDETAEIDRELVIAATESGNEYRTEEDTFPPRLIMTSTPHKHDTFFVKQLKDPTDWGFRKYVWKGEDSFNISEAKVQDAKDRLSSDEFKKEYLGQPVSSSTLLIDREDIQHSVIRDVPDADPNGYIALGIDWGRVHSTSVTVTQTQGDFIYILNNRMWKEKKFEWIKNQVMKMYDKYEADIIYADQSHEAVNERIRQAGGHIKQIPFTRSKQKMISNLQFMMERGKVKIPQEFDTLIDQLGEYHRNKTKDDDAVDSAMLSLFAQSKKPRTLERKNDEPPISIGGKRG